MKFFTLFFLSIVFSSQMKAQLLDIELDKYSNIICDSLKKFNEIDSSRTCVEIKQLMYSRKIKLNVGTVSYYEIGLTVSHGYKYLGIFDGKIFKILKSKDFTEDYLEIIKPFLTKKDKTDLNSFYFFWTEIKELYDYNINPPWKK